MTNLDKVIEVNKGKIFEYLADYGMCISKSSHEIFETCFSCTNKCADCINGSALRTWLKKEIPDTKQRYIVNGINNDKIEFATNYDIRKFNRLIKFIKQRKHGKWIRGVGLFGTKYICSNCGSWHTFNDNFCSNCGADMRALANTAKEPTDDCVAIEFSADINEPNKWQSKDGEWHTGKIPTKTEREENE